MDCCSGTQSQCCPEAVSTIAVSNTTLTIDSLPARRVQESLSLLSDLITAMCTYTPVTKTDVMLFVNGVMQQQGTDYSIVGRKITLSEPLIEDTVIDVYYYTVDDVPVTDGDIEVGMVMLWPDGVTVPTGWLECDGSEVSRTTYAALFAIWGTTYGVGDGSTTFDLANLSASAPSDFVYVVKL